MRIKLAEALLRRKELQDKVDQLRTIKEGQVFETISNRIKVADGIDQFTAKVPKLTAAQVTSEYDFYAKRLRMIDAAIQQANWTTEISDTGSVDVMQDYSEYRESSQVAE